MPRRRRRRVELNLANFRSTSISSTKMEYSCTKFKYYCIIGREEITDAGTLSFRRKIHFFFDLFFAIFVGIKQVSICPPRIKQRPSSHTVLKKIVKIESGFSAGFEKALPMARFEKVVPMARFEKTLSSWPRIQ
jgi:hypothetical protein